MRISVFCSAMLAYVAIGHPPPATAQDRGLAIEYTVKVADIPGQLFHVTTEIRNINQPALERNRSSRIEVLSLPRVT